jgi:hypothetical protein
MRAERFERLVFPLIQIKTFILTPVFLKAQLYSLRLGLDRFMDTASAIVRIAKSADESTLSFNSPGP